MNVCDIYIFEQSFKFVGYVEWNVLVFEQDLMNIDMI